MALASLILKIRADGAERARAAVGALKQEVRELGHEARTAAVIGLLGLGAGAIALGKTAFDAAVRVDSLTRALAGQSKDAADLTGQLQRLEQIAKLPGLGFEDAVEGSLRLQSAGLSAGLAERALAAFGNALAGAGKGKAELDGVTLALSQIASKGVISAEEIGQIAERFGGIREALKGAFGTADTEAIQKMGVTAEDAIARITAELEKLPSASGGIQNFLDNLSDSFQKALRPLGQGIVEMIEGSGGGVERLLSGLEATGRRVGEVFSAIGRSGAIGEVLETFSRAVNQLSGGMDVSPLASVAGALLSVVNNLPDAFSAAGEAVGAMVRNIQLAGQYLAAGAIAAAGAFQMAIQDPFNSAGLANMTRNFQMLYGVGTSILPDFEKLPDAGRFNLLADARRFTQGIQSNIKPLKALPDGLNFGGESHTDGAKKPATVQDNIDALLSRIEQNTRKTAEAFGLKELSSGLSEGAVPSALELRRAGGAGRASGDFRTSAGYVASDLEQALIARVADNLRSMGAGLSPARVQ